MEQSKTKQSLSRHIEHAVQDKRIGLSPQVKLLIQAIGETVESDIYDTDNEPLVLQLTDIVDINDDEAFHDTEDKSSYSSEDEWTKHYVLGPNKGEPSPLVKPDILSHWTKHVIWNISKYDDNITLPCIRLVFEKHNIPLISMHDEPTIFLFENNIGHAQSHEDIFHAPNPTTPTDYSFGSIINSNAHQDEPVHTTPTIHVCNHPIPYLYSL